MNAHPSLRRSLNAIAHPAALAAIALLALNDYVFKALAPSWLTGKLSDLAAAFLLTLVLAAAFSLLPGPFFRVGKAPILAGAALTAAGLILLKGWLPGHQVLLSAAAAAGFPLRAVFDPSDLLALAAIPFAYACWRNAANPRAAAPRWTWSAVSLAALLLVADAAAPDRGVACVAIIQGDLRAEVTYNSSYHSADGGYTWEQYGDLGNYACDSDSATMLDKAGPVQYRWVRGEKIERSADGGATWATDYTLRAPSGVEQAYINKVNPQNSVIGKGPFGAAEDPKTGNVIFAMGHEGVLVRDPAGNYTWVGVGRYNNTVLGPIPSGGQFALLQGEFFLAAAAVMLTFSTLALRDHRRWWRITKVVIGWAIWLFSLFVLPPAMSSGPYTEMFIFFAVLGALAWGLISVIDDAIGYARAKRRPSGRTILLSLLAGVIYLLPLLLWAFAVLPGYDTAVLISFVLIVILMGIGLFQPLRQQAGGIMP
ncbi:MAG TPA: hypothetical protein VIO36_11775 [Anaerolineaceae bacterium]